MKVQPVMGDIFSVLQLVCSMLLSNHVYLESVIFFFLHYSKVLLSISIIIANCAGMLPTANLGTYGEREASLQPAYQHQSSPPSAAVLKVLWLSGSLLVVGIKTLSFIWSLSPTAPSAHHTSHKWFHVSIPFRFLHQQPFVAPTYHFPASAISILPFSI